MESKEKNVELKAAAKGIWNRLPAILSHIPATKIAGNVMKEIKEAVDEAAKTGKCTEETKAAVDNFVEGQEKIPTLLEELKDEIQKVRKAMYPKYMYGAEFYVNLDDELTEEERERIISVIFDEEPSGDEHIDKFVRVLLDEYFCGGAWACEEPYEVTYKRVCLNFYDECDYEYCEEDLVIIRDELNRIVGREVFGAYKGYGTDDSVMQCSD